MFELTMRDLIVRNAVSYGDELAGVCGDKRITHREYLEQCNRLASALYKVGVRSQDPVSILSMNSLEIVIAYGACETHGLITSTVNFRLAPPEMQFIINDVAAQVLIFEDEFTGHIEQIRAELPHVRQFVAIGKAPEWATSWDDFLAGGDPEGAPLAPPTESDIACLIYTSGTTGKPKGCMIDHRALVAMANYVAGPMGLGIQDRALLMMPMFHIGAKSVVIAQQWVGGSYVLHRSFDPVAVLETIEREQITASHMAPILIQGMLDVPDIDRYDISSLRTVLYSAAAMPPVLLERALRTFGSIFVQMYGQTEGVGTLLPTTAHVLDDDPRVREKLGSIGIGFIGTEFSIRDDENDPLPTRAIGELCLRGPAMMRGYWNNSRATLAALRGGWLHTGDVGFMDEEGYIYLVDRKKDVINTGGENVYSREVEDAVLAHPAVDNVAVIGLPDERWGEAVTAVIVLKPGATLSEAELETHCRARIAGYKRPRNLRFVDALPVMPSGKVNKVALREIFAK